MFRTAGPDMWRIRESKWSARFGTRCEHGAEGKSPVHVRSCDMSMGRVQPGWMIIRSEVEIETGAKEVRKKHHKKPKLLQIRYLLTGVMPHSLHCNVNKKQ